MSTKQEKRESGARGRHNTSGDRRRTLLDVSRPSERELAMASFMNDHIVGQPGLVGVAGRAYRQAFNPLRDGSRPIYTIFALGKRGTGKTFTPKMLARFLHGDEEALIRIPCGAYKERHRVSQLLGAPPSYVGHRDKSETGKLKPTQVDPSARLSRHNIVASRKGSDVPVSILVFDEIEKASEYLEDVLLSIMHDGEVDLGSNEPADFRDCIIFLTGNVGAFELSKLGKTIGFHQGVVVVTQDDIENTVWKVLNERYKPEFLDRIDEVVIAENLSDEDLRAIVDVQVELFMRRVEDQLPRGLQFDLVIDEAARDFIFSEATKNTDSARGISRAIGKHLEQPLGGELVKNSISLGDLVEVTHEQGNDTLSFYLTEGEGYVSAADQMVLPHGDSGAKLGFQRRVDRAGHKARTADKSRYVVRFEGENRNALSQMTVEFIHDAKEVFGVRVVRTVFEEEGKPFVLEFTVLAIDEQIELIRDTFGEAVISKVTDDDDKAA